MNLPDPRIVKFLKEHHVLTLATSADNRPWCANCFYVFLENEAGFIFTSELETRHVQEALVNIHVAGTVVLESDIAGKIQGLQFEGKLRIPDQQLVAKAKIAYLKRYPMTSLIHTTLWFLEVSHMKYTDSRLLRGNKLFWKR